MPREVPDPASLDRIRQHLAGDSDSGPWYALDAALAAAQQRGRYAYDQTRGHHGPAAERFLVVLQAAVEELKGIAAAVAAGEGQGVEEG